MHMAYQSMKWGPCGTHRLMDGLFLWKLLVIHSCFSMFGGASSVGRIKHIVTLTCGVCDFHSPVATYGSCNDQKGCWRNEASLVADP